MPSPKKIPLERSLFGETVIDNYAWMRNRDDPDTIAYLESENALTQSQTAHLAELRETIFEEIKSRTLETDLSAPARKGPWWYARQTEEGRQYPVFVRMPRATAPPQILLDVNALAKGHDYLALGAFKVSPDHRIVAYSTDTTGAEIFEIRFRDLESGTDLPDSLSGAYYSCVWGAAVDCLYYTTLDSAHRPDKVWRHQLGTHQSEDQLIFEEPDERFFVGVNSTQDERYILISASSQTTSDVRFLPAFDLTATPKPILPRISGVEYSVDHHHGRWLIVTNEDAINGKLLSVSTSNPSDLVELIPHNPMRKIADVFAFRSHVIVSGRRDGLTSITVLPDEGNPYDLEFDEDVFTVNPTSNLEYETAVLRIAYQSLVTPPQIVDIDLNTGRRTLVKETPVLGGYEPDQLSTRRAWAKASDGTMIPISIVHATGTRFPAPFVLYGYGAYEIPVDPWFSISRLSLLERGIAFAIAHIRGGGEFGKPWYEAGKLAEKMNSFTDFIACAEHLSESGISETGHLAIRGGSAGGLLMGAATNMKPSLFDAVVAEVPFVDVVNTMLDETLPLTVTEREEWGDPREPEPYQWMRRYSPYENVREAQYPSMLVTAGLNDPRVSYWEPAKWVARLREMVIPRGPILLKTKMESGHGGATGRYDVWRDEAFVLSWIVDQIGDLD